MNDERYSSKQIFEIFRAPEERKLTSSELKNHIMLFRKNSEWIVNEINKTAQQQNNEEKSL